MVGNSRVGSHQVLLRQLQRSVDRSIANPREEDQVAEEQEEEGEETSRVANAGDDGEEEEEDLFGQIGPELVQQGRGGGSGGRDDWGDGATLALLQAWEDKCVALNKWHLRLDHWAELATAVTQRSHSPKTDVQCKNRVDTLKKKFKLERQRQIALGSPSKWAFYRILDRLLAMASSAKSSGGGGAARSPSLPVGADAGSIVRNRGSAKRHLHGSSSSEEEEEEEEEEERGEDEDEDEEKGGGRDSDEEQELDKGGGGEEDDLLWGFTSASKKKKKRRKLGRSCSSSSTCSSPLADAIAKLGNIFDRMEECKRQQLLDLEKLRCQFSKDLELHRIQLLVQTQRELAKIQHSVDIQ